ncbi:MAG: sodium:solute symporter family protein [Clostridia bacterium]|jgi:sodium/pantothenate symporter|nr:sodium:solute symporter family protein [Clostridia bacterium]
MNNVFIIGVFATFLLYVIVGNYAGKKVKNAEDYFIAGRNAPTVLIVGTLVASFLSTVAFMGETGFGYDGYPILLLVLMGINGSGYIVGVLYFGRYLRRSQALTLGEYFGDRFNSQKVRMAIALITIVGIGAYLVAVTQGASILMSELLGTSYGISLIIVWLVYTSFTFYSGSKGVILTDTIMFFFFMIAAVIATPYLFKAAGGWPEAITKLAIFQDKPDIMAWHGMTGENAFWATPTDAFIWAIVLGFVWAAVVATSPWQTSRYLMAKSEHVTLRAGMLATVAVLGLYLILPTSAATINLVNPDIVPSENSYIWAAMNIMPTWLGVIVLGGVMAAAISSCSTFLSLVGFSVSKDIIQANSKYKNIEDKQLLYISRVVMLVVGLISLGITFTQPPAVMWIGYFAATLFAASWGPTAFASVFSKRITATGAFWGIVGGFVAVVVTEAMRNYAGVAFPVYFRPPIIGALVSVLGIVIGSALTKVSPKEIAYREKLFIVPESELDPKEIERTMLYPKIVMGIGVAMIVVTYVFYYLPYSRAIG